MKGRVSLALASTLILLTAPVSVPAVSATGDPATEYVQCMDQAEIKFHLCLEKATVTEWLCWSRYGYAKLWCTSKYLVGAIID